MKLVTFQSMDALKNLMYKGYLECNPDFINLKKSGYAYDWIIEKMNQQIKNFSNAKYPVWCWVKCKKGNCPPKHKGNKVVGFDVKITFNKDVKEVFITDYRLFSFILNNTYIPNNLKDKNEFAKKLIKYNITSDDLKAYVRKDKYENHRTDNEFLEVCKEIRKSFDKCITNNGDILQGCIWRINLEDIEKIEFLKEDGYTYGSYNYIRSNGERFNWIEDYYQHL
ncbi:MAG: DUF3841 domain-containing protein [Bacilli bacterium]|nr:DUF3841 domain-containing protein [Bacilli bacterium]